MLKLLIAAVVMVGCGGSGDDASDPHAHVDCGNQSSTVAICEAACVNVPAFTDVSIGTPPYDQGSCTGASSGSAHNTCSQTFTLPTGERGCCETVGFGTPGDTVEVFLECP